GTTYTHLKTEAYNLLRDAFVSMTHDIPRTDGYGILDPCYDFSGKQTASVTLGFLFAGGKVLQLPPENYLIPVNTQGKYCFAFAPTNAAVSIIGNVQQQGIRVSYDLVNSVVGFSPNKC
ncbi:pepsin-like aspartyl protease, partial [Salmonella sp. s58078]|uniref:pepsin-like aspartyl protease n=1 Tax=Salmonella sp. s58078 TaxID=3159699 RepID=UPI00397F95FE